MPKFRLSRKTGKARKPNPRLAAIFAVLALLFGVTVTTVGTATPAAVDATPAAVIGMPFTGKWAWNAIVQPNANGGYVDECPSGQTTCPGLSSHPSVHHTPGNGDWATDIYAAEGTAVKLKVNYATAALTYSWASSSTTCGTSTRINIFVGGTNVGWLYFAHLNNAVTSGNITNGMTLGTVKLFTNATGVCNPGTHVHVEFHNTTNYSCYVDQGNPGASVLDEGTNFGVLGSSNTAKQQACGDVPGATSTAPPPVVNHPEGVATVAYNGTLQAFYYSRSSGTLRHAVMNSSGSWSNFENLDGNAGSIAGQLGSYGTQTGVAIDAIVFNNTLYVFYYVASSGNLRVMWTSPTQGWQVTNLDGDVGSLAWQAGNYATHTGQSISAAVFGSTLQVFYTADGGRVRHAVKSSSGAWSNFENLDGNAGSIASQIGPYTTANASVNSIVDASGVLHVFYPTSDSKLRHMWTSATQGWQLQSLDGDVGSVAGQLNSGSFATPAGGVDSIVDSSGVLRVFYNTTAGLRTMWTSASQTWQVTNLDGDPGSLAGQAGNYGTNIGASISSAVDANGSIQLVYPANGELRHAAKSPTGSWSNFENLDGDAGSIAGQLGSYGANVGNPASVSVLGSTIQILYRQASNGDMRTMTTTPPTSGWAVTNLDGDAGSLAGQAGNYGTDLG